MPGRRSKLPFRISPGIQSSLTKSLVRMLVVRCKIQVALNQQRPREGVVADSVAPHPRICQRQRHQKQNPHDPMRKFRTNRDTLTSIVVLTLQPKATRSQRRNTFHGRALTLVRWRVYLSMVHRTVLPVRRIQRSSSWGGKSAAEKTIVGLECSKPRLEARQLASRVDARTRGR